MFYVCYCFSGAHITEEEIIQAEDKFEESKTLAETAMWNLIENDVSSILTKWPVINGSFVSACEILQFTLLYRAVGCQSFLVALCTESDRIGSFPA